jgi:hypothetical protein
VSKSTVDVLPKSESPTSGDEKQMRVHSAENCAKIKNLGFIASRHIKMYGERFEIVSDPFSEGAGVAVHATSGTDPEIRTVRLPTAILVGAKGRFLKKPDLKQPDLKKSGAAGQSTS